MRVLGDESQTGKAASAGRDDGAEGRGSVKCLPENANSPCPQARRMTSIASSNRTRTSTADRDERFRRQIASTARRQFKRYCGMTFQAYHRARRMGLALADIRKGKTVIDSQLDQGFESGSGFREAFTRLRLRPRARVALRQTATPRAPCA